MRSASRLPAVHQRWARLIAAVGILAALVAYAWRPLANLWALRQARQAYSERDFDRASEWVSDALRRDPRDPQALLFAARIYRRAGRIADAESAITGARQCGADPRAADREQLLCRAQIGDMRRAEPRLPELLRDSGPDGDDICAAYVAGYFRTLRMAEAHRLLDAWERDYPLDPEPRFMRGFAWEAVARFEQAERAYTEGLRIAPTRSEMRLRRAETLRELRRWDEAREEYARVRERQPRNDIAAIGWAHCLFAAGELTAARRIVDEVLRDSAKAEARALAGELALAAGEFAAAETHLQAAFAARPHDTAVRYSLAKCLTALGKPSEAQPHFDFIAAARQPLDDMERNLGRALENPRDAEVRFAIGSTMMRFADPIDGAQWLRSALEIDPTHSGAKQLLASLDKGAPSLPESNPSAAFPLASPLASSPAASSPAASSPTASSPFASSSSKSSPSALSPSAESFANRGAIAGVATANPANSTFDDIAAATGIRHTYRNGEESGQCAMIESLGGGVAALDYDRDGWFDLYYSGGGTIASSRAAGLPGSLWRNGLGDVFFAVTNPAYAGAGRHYSHGVASADFDEDGFPDLLITGFGGMQLLHNQGDGTFTDRTASAGLEDASWSTSAAWGDVTGDGVQDLYVARYLDWSFANHPRCVGASRPDQRDLCNPHDFAALPDRLLVGRGDGTFVDATRESAIRDDGKGLGVVMADVDLDGDLDIYVANDATANFLYRNDGSGRLEEIGLVAGCGLDATGAADGSMGVDIEDYDADGRPDIWVVNYEREAHALYRGQPGGLFTHASQTTGIAGVAGLFVGWGTMFADHDLDGDLDLLVSNGHTNKYPLSGERPQQLLLLTQHQGRFTRRPFSRGTFLGDTHPSRGVAALDWDNDGDVDFAVSRVNEPSALLANRPPANHHWLSVELIGVNGTRDAIGASVHVASSGKTQTRLAKGGGSYLSTSDRRLHFGLGNQSVVERLEVRWPGGRVQTLHDVKADRLLRIVEPSTDDR